MKDKELEQLKASNDELLKNLIALIRVFTEGRNYNTQNPYTRPEIESALKAIKHTTGYEGDWMDAINPPPKEKNE